MKKIIALFLLLATSSFGQLKKKEMVSDISFKNILNAPVKHIQLDDLKGKIVLIEFWATWCGACLDVMPHLNKLQEKYKNQLQVITVTDETTTRIMNFLTVKPSNLWFAIDTDSSINKRFPHRMIPHTILITTEGKLAAATDPLSVTSMVIDSLLDKKELHLPEKKDLLIEPEELLNAYFFAADTVKERFSMQSSIEGAAGMSTTYRNQPVFKDRRITCINLDLKTLYEISYENFSSKRVFDKTSQNDKDQNYCLDIIVKEQKDLLPTMQKELLKRFDLKGKIQKQNREVYVLEIDDLKKFRKIPINKSNVRTYTSSHGAIDQQSINMFEFAKYLETYGTGLLPVIDETHTNIKFDIKFSFQPEAPDSLNKILKNMGLVLKKQHRMIDLLVLYKD